MACYRLQGDLENGSSVGTAAEELIRRILIEEGFRGIDNRGGKTLASGAVNHDNDLVMISPQGDHHRISVKSKRVWKKGGKNISLGEVAEMMNRKPGEVAETFIVWIGDNGICNICRLTLVETPILPSTIKV